MGAERFRLKTPIIGGVFLRTRLSKQVGDSRQLLGVPRTNETPYELGGPSKREKSGQLLGVPRT